MKTSKLLSAPIPGENLTVNNKVYAWHKPPQFPEFDDAFEHLVDDVLAVPNKMAAAMLMTSNGISALAVAQTILIHKVSQGKISPDMSLLIAGPFYKTLVRMLDAAGAVYLTGFDTPEELRAYAEKMKSGEVLTAAKKAVKLTPSQEAEMERITEEAIEEIPVGGLMGAQATTEDMFVEDAEE